jgi:peptidoglycan lytic transglycosylase
VTRRLTRRCGLLGALASLALSSGCAPYKATTHATGTTGQSPVVAGEEPRSDRGNPPFYDVLGKRYYVLTSSAGYRATGIASWYGREFHGLTTSSGEPYDMHAMTAAHTTLPIPTWVEVTNLDNGKRVIVKVNDRGPFVDNRLIDLSYAAAQSLDMVRNGTARVEVRSLGSPDVGGTTIVAAAPAPPTPSALAAAPAPPTPSAPPALRPSIVSVAAVATILPERRPAEEPAPARNAAPTERLFVQVGAFAQRDNAQKLVTRLRANGFGNSFIVTERDGPRTLHRVRLGPLGDPQEFDELSNRLRKLGVGDSRLVVDR